MRFSFLPLLALVGSVYVYAADLPSTTASSASSVSASTSASASASSSGNSTTAAPSSTSAAVSVVQSVITSGNSTRTVNVTQTASASSTPASANASTAVWTGQDFSATAFAPGVTASGVVSGPGDGYVAAAGKLDLTVGTALVGAIGAVLGLAALL